MSLFLEEHERFRARVRSYVEERLTPHADEWESQGAFPGTLFEELGQEGFLGLCQPKEYGGSALDFAYNVVLVEELPRSHMMGLTLSVIAQTNIFPPLLGLLGTEEQKREFLVPAIQGKKIGAVASSEPTGGSDIVRSIRCTAREDGDYWVLNGEKKYITNGPIADFVVALVRTREDPSINSLSLVIVPTDAPGFRVKETLRKLGLHTSPTGWLEFSNCRVPKGMMLGRPNLGYHYVARNILEERLIGGACAVSLATLVLADTIKYLKTRSAFGRGMTDLQAIRHRISEVAAEIEVSKRFVHSVCESYRDGHVEAKEICMMKFHVFEMVQRVVERCLQLNGGSGFLEENWIARAYRDVRVLSIGGGPSELMKDLVAAYLRL